MTPRTRASITDGLRRERQRIRDLRAVLAAGDTLGDREAEIETRRALSAAHDRLRELVQANRDMTEATRRESVRRYRASLLLAERRRSGRA